VRRGRADLSALLLAAAVRSLASDAPLRASGYTAVSLASDVLLLLLAVLLRRGKAPASLQSQETQEEPYAYKDEATDGTKKRLTSEASWLAQYASPPLHARQACPELQ
jgi:hypothetical protein